MFSWNEADLCICNLVEKNLNGDDAAREPNLISTIELITPENGENSQAADRSQTLKAQSGMLFLKLKDASFGS